MVIAKPSAEQELALPTWIPGSYLVREFSKNLQQLSAQQNGKDVPLQQLDKHRWTARCTKSQPLVLTYQVAAYDHSVRTAWLDSARGFFNGTSVCLRAVGQEDKPHGIDIAPPARLKGWQVATGLTPVHTNRELQRLRKGRFITLEGQRLSIGDLRAMRRVGQYWEQPAPQRPLL